MNTIRPINIVISTSNKLAKLLGIVGISLGLKSGLAVTLVLLLFIIVSLLTLLSLNGNVGIFPATGSLLYLTEELKSVHLYLAEDASVHYLLVYHLSEY